MAHDFNNILTVIQGHAGLLQQAVDPATPPAKSADQILEAATRPFDLLVTDMVMPDGILGGELAERLLERNPHLKVIYTSGYSPGMAGKDVSLLEGRNFLPKPYSIGKLAKFVRECLDAPMHLNRPSSSTKLGPPKGAETLVGAGV